MSGPPLSSPAMSNPVVSLVRQCPDLQFQSTRLDKPLYLRNKFYDKTLNSQYYYSNILRFPVPWRSALWLYNTSWLDQNLSRRFLKQLTVSAESTRFERLFHIGITRLVKLNFLKTIKLKWNRTENNAIVDIRHRPRSGALLCWVTLRRPRCPTRVASTSPVPLWANMTPSRKLEVHETSQKKRMAEPRPQATYRDNNRTFGFQMCSRTCRHADTDALMALLCTPTGCKGPNCLSSRTSIYVSSVLIV